MTDGRTLVGLFLCTDRDCNVILGSAQEFLKSTGTQRRPEHSAHWCLWLHIKRLFCSFSHLTLFMVLYYQSIFEVSFQERFKHTGVLSNCDFTQYQTILKVINKAKNNTDQNQQLWETHTRCFCHSLGKKTHREMCKSCVVCTVLWFICCDLLFWNSLKWSNFYHVLMLQLKIISYLHILICSLVPRLLVLLRNKL